MTDSQLESSTNKSEEIRQRAFRLILFLGVAGILWGVIFASLSEAGRAPLSLISSFGAGIVQLIAAYLIYKRRLFLGVIIAAITALAVPLTVMTQTSGIGIVIVAAELLIYMMILPLIITEEEGLSRIQIGAVIAAAILILADLYWPYPRNSIDPELVRVTYIFLAVLVGVFAVVLARRFPTFSLRGKLISATLAVTLMAVFVMAVGVSSVTRNSLTQEIGSNLELLARSQGLAIGELMSQQVSNLESLALNNTLQVGAAASNVSYTDGADAIQSQLKEVDLSWARAADDDPLITTVLENKLAAELIKYQRNFDDNVEVFMTDRYGALLASTNRTSDFYQADEAWWQEAYNNGQGDIYIGEPEFDDSSNTLAINIAVPISSPIVGGEIVGVLRTTYDLAALNKVLTAARFEETGRIDLYLPDGDEVTLNNNGEAVLQLAAHGDIISALQDGDELYTSAFYRDELSLISLAKVASLTEAAYVDQLNWSLVASQAEAEGLASVVSLQRFSIMTGMVVILLVAGVGAFVGQRLTSPIVNLTNVAQQVTAGDLTVHAAIESQDEVGTLAQAFNNMTAQLRNFIDSLEQRVADRTRALEISGNVSRQLSNILERDKLVQAVVEQVKESFAYYHAHIYLFDDTVQNLMMVGGTGEAGQQMLAEKHQIPAGKGLVGRAGQTGQPVLVPDTAQAEDWLPNPLLPDTKAEIAVPIMSGEKVWGVLDVQHNVIDGLSQADVDLLESIANQVAVALRNARLFEEVQQQAKREVLMNEINQKIANTKDVEEAMQVAAREIGRALNAAQTIVRFTQADDSSKRFGDTKPLKDTNGQQK